MTVDGRADLHRSGAAQQSLDGGGTVVHTRRNGDVQLRQRMGAQRRAAEHVAQLGRLAERIAVHEAHLLDVDVGLEEAVVEHQTPGAAAQQSVAERQHVRQAHREFHRHGDRHRSGDLAHDVGIVLFDLLRRSLPVGRQKEDVQLQRRSPGRLHGRSVLDPRVARTHAVDASDDGNARLGGIGDELQQFGLVGVAQIAFEILARVAVTLHLVQRGGLTVNLLLEDGFQHHGAGAVADALLDIVHVCRIGGTADHDGACEFQPEIFRFHRELRYLSVKH